MDIPEVMSLVFMKPVRSPIKLQQMIGRGTRSQAACKFLDWLPEGGKKEFLILDFGRTTSTAPPKRPPIPVCPFSCVSFTRLNLLETYLNDQRSPQAPNLELPSLRAMIERIPRESLLVRHALPEHRGRVGRRLLGIPAALQPGENCACAVAPHLRYAADVDVPAETFTAKLERLKLLRRKEQPAGDCVSPSLKTLPACPKTCSRKQRLRSKRACTCSPSSKPLPPPNWMTCAANWRI